MPYGSGFLIFSDYGRPPIRLAALMEIPVIYVFTHDSIGVGEDGPTHQPIEQLRVACGRFPGLIVLRPAMPTKSSRPGRTSCSCVTSRSALVLCAPGGADAGPHQVRRRPPAWPAAPTSWPTPPAASPTCCCIATGSEVHLCVDAYEKLQDRGHQGPRRQHAVMGNVRGALPENPPTAKAFLPPA